MRYYMLVGQTPVATSNAEEWAKWFQEADRKVALTRIGPYEVSTVFLGLDHNWSGGSPLLFETMVFMQALPGEKFPASLDCARCRTWIEAEEQHKRMVLETRAKVPDLEVVEIL